MKWLLIIAGIGVLVVVAVMAIGALLPRDHVAASTAVITGSSMPCKVRNAS